MKRPRAVVFDFNGTLSQDEGLLWRLYAELFAKHGRPLPEAEYFDGLAGLSDEEMVRAWLGPDYPAVDELVQTRIDRYRTAVADGSTISRAVREAARYALERLPVAVVSSATRAEVEPVLAAAGLLAGLRAVVTLEDVARAKPAPDPYTRALELLGDGVLAEDAVAFEDTAPGVASAKAAGLRCVAVLGTATPEQLAAADEIAPALDVALMRRVLG